MTPPGIQTLWGETLSGSRRPADAIKGRLQSHTTTAEAIRYGLSRKAKFGRFLEDGRVYIDNNGVARNAWPASSESAANGNTKLNTVPPSGLGSAHNSP